MAAWEKSPPQLVERFGRIVDEVGGLERRQMFGYPAAFLGGNLVTSLHQASWLVRLSATDQAAVLAAGGRVFEPMAGRTMKNFVTLPAAVLEDDDALRRWVARASEHGRTLPPKK